MPKFRGSAEPVTVQCAANGESSSQRFGPVNVTVENIRNSGNGARIGLVGALIVAAVEEGMVAARDPLKDEYSYQQNMYVDFKNFGAQ